MGTLTSLVALSRAALTADQAALNATSNNVANQNTTGYVRQVVSWESGDFVTLTNGQNPGSTGPQVTVASQRDRVLEQRIQQQAQAVAASSGQSSILSQIESVFGVTSSGDTTGSTQIGTAMDSFFASLTSLASAPSDSATRQGVLSAAKTLVAAFNSASTQLSQVASTLNGQVSSTVTQVNALTQTIASLNKEISANSPNTDAGTLEDQRQTAIMQLSQYIGLDQIKTEDNGISLTTVGGASLVAGSKAYQLAASNTGSDSTILDGSGTDITGGIMGGSLGGLLSAKSGDLAYTISSLDQLAYSIATQVNQQNEAGLDANGVAGQAIFGLPSTAVGAAGAITVVATSSSAVAAAGVGEGKSGNTNASALADLPLATGTSGQTFSAFYATLLSYVGTNSSAMTAQTTAQQSTLTLLTSQRDSFSAVSLDEEAANLTQYQRSYEAAAKLFNIADSLTVSALNLGVQTAVS